MDSVPNILKVATFNIRNTQDRYDERRDYLKETLQGASADIMGLQEVAFGQGGQLEDLISKEGAPLFDKYLAESQLKFHELERIDKEQRIDGNAIIVRKGLGCVVESEKLLHLSHVRVAQKLSVTIAEEKLLIVNVHLHHTVGESMIRLHQVRAILSWVRDDESNQNAVVVIGDFNFTPFSEEYGVMEAAGYQSAYKVIHKKEPEKTFPTGLTGPFMDKDEEGTFDYVWFKGGRIQGGKASLFGCQQLPGKEGIYPSDHCGILVEFLFI